MVFMIEGTRLIASAVMRGRIFSSYTYYCMTGMKPYTVDTKCSLETFFNHFSMVSDCFVIRIHVMRAVCSFVACCLQLRSASFASSELF